MLILLRFTSIDFGLEFGFIKRGISVVSYLLEKNSQISLFTII